MTSKQREKIIKEATKRRFKVLLAKQKEYSGGNKDVNYNFNSINERIGTRLAGTPAYICLVYLFKHINSLEHWAKTGQISSGETIYSRLDDIRNYLDLLEVLLKTK